MTRLQGRSLARLAFSTRTATRVGLARAPPCFTSMALQINSPGDTG